MKGDPKGLPFEHDYAVFSEEHKRIGGSAEYESLDTPGALVEVTWVGPSKDMAALKWGDKQYRGRVGRFIRTIKESIYFAGRDDSTGEMFVPLRSLVDMTCSSTISDIASDAEPDAEDEIKYGLYNASQAEHSGTCRYRLRDSPTETIIVSMVVTSKAHLDEFCEKGWECRGIVDERVGRETEPSFSTDWFTTRSLSQLIEAGENDENDEPSAAMYDMEEVD